MKLLSVAVPCYNVEPYLEKCLSSFCGEGLEDALEVLIVDDGSQDKTAEIARGFVAPSGKNLVCIPAFQDIAIDGEERTAIKLIIEAK